MADARIERTQRALHASLLSLVGEKAFGDLSIGEIVARAGIGYATFFRHYRDKDALLAEVADTLMDDLLAKMMPALLHDETRVASVALCRFVDEHRSVCRALLAGGAEDSIRQHVVKRALSRAETVALPPVDGLPPDLAISHAVRAMLGLLGWWLDHEGSFDADGMGAIIDRLVMGPIRSAATDHA